MTDYADIYFVDGRNALNDHRSPGTPSSPGRVMITQPPAHQGVRTVITTPTPYGATPMYAAPPGYFGPQGPGFWPAQGPGYWGPNGWVPQQGPFSVLSRLGTGQLIDIIAQGYAALMQLPAPPVATGQAATDVGNLILYQGSLASYAKRDEQIRTLGSLVSKLVG